jgi:hypothetical protein
MCLHRQSCLASIEGLQPDSVKDAVVSIRRQQGATFGRSDCGPVTPVVGDADAHCRNIAEQQNVAVLWESKGYTQMWG